VPWTSCIVLPLADQDDLLALLLLVSPRRSAFPAAAVEEVLAIRTMAAVALARHLHVEGRQTPEARQAEEQSRRAQGMFQERLRQLEMESTALAQDNRLKSERMELLAREVDRIQNTAHQERAELERLRQELRAIDEQATTAAKHLNDAYTELATTQQRLNDQQDTMDFLREVFEASQLEHDDALMSRALVQRFCEAFSVDRCSLMRVDDRHLHIAAHRGMDPDMAGQVRLPVGQGVAGWVAHHRKPVLMRKHGDASPVRPTGVDHYNSDSFVSVPLVHRNRLLGVLNLSNKRDGKAFNETDLDRAMMASAVLSMAMGVREAAQAGPTRGTAVVDAEALVAAPSLVSPLSLEQRELPPFEMRG
jgi:transcriptional regulator with GAF, ATPase, and Fis domain